MPRRRRRRLLDLADGSRGSGCSRIRSGPTLTDVTGQDGRSGFTSRLAQFRVGVQKLPMFAY